MTDLAHHIKITPLVDTHEHLLSEAEYVKDGPDVLQSIFHTYIGLDLITSRVSKDVADRVIDSSDPDVEGRWNCIKDAWEYCRFTSYGQAARITARLVYGIEEITLDSILTAAERNKQLRQPGERLRLLREVANLDHVQINHHAWACEPDLSGPEFFLYDISWVEFCSGQPDLKQLYEETQVEVRDTASLRQAMAALFEKYGGCAVAVKAQHAYDRTLAWVERDDADVEPVLQKVLRGDEIDAAERLCLGDWCWARGVELAAEHNLPFKIHTGIMAFNSTMTDPFRLQSGNLGTILARYPDTRFVLMHMAYPYTDELVGMAKNFPNVYVDMCWGWALNFRAAVDFVRQMIHAVPYNKLFAFGGDTFWPAQVVGYAAQARDGLTRALSAEVEEGTFCEAEAIQIATCLMRENQMACFDIENKQATILSQLSAKNG
ncbi:MAG: amidohydrolase family protein [Anaerolineae bacterium]|nr:amidohydrolase family protein [Anaerolineae bacterium]